MVGWLRPSSKGSKLGVPSQPGSFKSSGWILVESSLQLLLDPTRGHFGSTTFRLMGRSAVSVVFPPPSSSDRKRKFGKPSHSFGGYCHG